MFFFSRKKKSEAYLRYVLRVSHRLQYALQTLKCRVYHLKVWLDLLLALLADSSISIDNSTQQRPVIMSSVHFCLLCGSLHPCNEHLESPLEVWCDILD